VQPARCGGGKGGGAGGGDADKAGDSAPLFPDIVPSIPF